MTKLPKISVVTPSYNQGRFIEETIKSVLGQNYPNLEYIIIDGGSQDDTIEVINKYKDKISYFVSEKDEGQTHAISKGFEVASGDILCWINSDDRFLDGTFEKVARYFLANSQSHFVYGNCIWINEAGDTLYRRREMDFSDWLWHFGYNYIPQPSAFWRSGLYYGLGGIDRSYSLAMDTELFSRMSEVVRIDHMDEFLSEFRVHAAQRSTVQRRRLEQEVLRIVSRHYGREVGPREKFFKGIMARAVRYSYRKAILRSR